ncbi:MAG: hypothetical protein IKG40_02390 [Bacilli bacterium]|nr:hypothetical protein [Bacilli bacterium]
MKLIFKDNKIILCLNKIYIRNLDLNNKEELYKYIKKTLHKLEKKYDLTLQGYYSINLYIDNNYGIIMEITKEESSYLDYFENSLDISIKIYKESFLYEVSDIIICNNYKTYINNNHIYINIKKDISEKTMTKFIEKVIDIKYGVEKDTILKKLKVLG